MLSAGLEQPKGVEGLFCGLRKLGIFELAPVQRTLASGFDETVVAIGDNVVAHGHRAIDEADYRMKAVRLVVGDATYDVYPEFAAELDQ